MQIGNVSGYKLQVGYNYKSRQTVFKSRIDVQNQACGKMSKAAQTGLENIHGNLAKIRDLFLLYANYPAKSNAIKDGYSGLLQKNRAQGLSFALPENRGSIVVRPLRAETDMLRLVVDDRGTVTNFYTKGNDKVVANINQNSPQNLPRRYRYMTDEEIKKSNIEEYIQITDAEISKYNDYLEQFRDKGKANQLTVIRKNSMKKRTSTLEPKDNIKRVEAIFAKSDKDFPDDFKLQKTSSGKVLGFDFKTDDGTTIKVAKISSAKYGNNMIYLNFAILYPNGQKSFMGVDLLTNKFLRLKDNGKLLIRNDAVYEYSEEDVAKRKMNEKLSNYVDEIYKKFDVKKEQNKKDDGKGVIANTLKKPVSITPEEKPTVIEQEPKIAEVQDNIPEKGLQKELTEENFDKLKAMTIEKAKVDAQKLADIYYKTFIQSFNEIITKKLSDFKSGIEKLFVKE